MDVSIRVGKRGFSSDSIRGWAASGLQIFFGLGLIYSGLVHLNTGTGELRRMLASGRILPAGLDFQLATYLPWAEIALAVLLLSGHWRRAAWCCMALFLTAGAGMMTLAWINVDSSVKCGCNFVLGGDSVAVGILRNTFLLGLVFFGFRMGSPPRTAPAPGGQPSIT